MMNNININDKNSLKISAEIMEKGGVIIFPTDTVYGIGCLLNQKAIKKLYKIKNRPLSQPTAVLLSKQLYGKLRSSVKNTIDGDIEREFLSGKITIIFAANQFDIKFPKMILKDGSLGVRLPEFVWFEKLINLVGPIVATSANKKGKIAPRSFREIDPQVIKEADLTVKTDKTLGNKPSQVYDLKEQIFLRK